MTYILGNGESQEQMKELKDVWQDPFGDDEKPKPKSSHLAASELMRQMQTERRHLIATKLEKRKQEEQYLKF